MGYNKMLFQVKKNIIVKSTGKWSFMKLHIHTSTTVPGSRSFKK